jgi:hypothetical protein
MQEIAMKLSPILIAATLAFGGTAMAQSQDTYKRTDDRPAKVHKKGDDSSMVDKTKRGAERVGDATKRGAKKAAAVTGSAAHRAADATRSAGQSIERKLPPAPGQTQQANRGSSGETGTPGANTTAMGAGPAPAGMSGGDHDRQARMDDAYANWQRKSDKR